MQQWRLAARPIGRMLQDSDFTWEPDAPMPVPGEGEVLVKVLYLSFDPALKGWMEGIANYVAPMQVGDVMRGGGVGEVVESNHPGFAPGDIVQGTLGWREYVAVAPGDGVINIQKVAEPVKSLTAPLGVLGTTGLTAYTGMLAIGRPNPGDTVVVSGAAGATGSIAGQIGKIMGCRVVGIAGGAAKCAWLVEELGFDAAIDYKAENLDARLGDLCPEGIDVFYDNVGGEILNTTLKHLAMNARVVICGIISRHETGHMPKGPENYAQLIFKRATMQGFIVLDYAATFPQARRRLWQWVEEGRLKDKEDIQEGLHSAPQTFMRLFKGQNFGKQLLKLA